MYSLTQAGNLVTILSMVLGVSMDDASGFVKVIIAIVGFVSVGISWIGRYRAGGISLLGTRKYE